MRTAVVLCFACWPVISACGSGVERINGPSGRVAYSIECSRPAACYNQAARACSEPNRAKVAAGESVEVDEPKKCRKPHQVSWPPQAVRAAKECQKREQAELARAEREALSKPKPDTESSAPAADEPKPGRYRVIGAFQRYEGNRIANALEAYASGLDKSRPQRHFVKSVSTLIVECEAGDVTE